MKQLYWLRGMMGLTTFILLSLVGTLRAQTQLPECTADVPFFVMDLSANPNLTYTTPEFVRQTGCCGDGDRYVSFYVTLHPDVAMFELIVAPGYADPGGSGNYNIISGDLLTPGSCGTQIPGGAPICITGSGPHKIVYSKPGNNKVRYIFRQIPKPIYPLDQPTRVGCTLPLPIYGLNNIAINAIAKSPNFTGSLATANTFMSCLNCADPIFQPGANASYPYTITYEVTGTPQAAACGSYPTSGQFTVTVYDALNISVTPNPGTFCSGGPGVNLNATATGGDSNYSYLWFNSDGDTVATTASYLAPAEGIYTAQVTDGLVTATCPSSSVSVPVTVANPPVVSAGPDLTACASAPSVILNGNVDFANPLWVGGNGTFTPNRTSEVVSYTPTPAEIASGSVILTLTSTDAGGGCAETSDAVTIFYSNPMIITETIGTIACFGQTTTVSVVVSGGIPGYTYEWNTGATTDAITVPAGTYGLTVTDQYSCTATEYYTVNQPTPINLVTSSTDEVLGNDGSVGIEITGGDPDYTVVWTDDLSNVVGNDLLNTSPYISTVNPLGYGFYTATVTDGNGCTVASSVVVNTAACSGLGVNVSATDVDCYGNSTGSVTAAPFGGVGPYTFEWENNPLLNTATINGLPAGIYTVEITDVATSCVDVASVAVFQPTQLTNTITQTDVTVQGGNDGTATANPLGGTPIYSYEWSTAPMQTTQTATGLIAGTYSVEITDAEGCIFNDDVLINEPPCNDFILAVNTTNVLCNGGNTGAANLFISNGTPPFSISWSSGQTDVYSVSGLIAGPYSVTVTDDNGCVSIKNFTITQPDAISLGLDPTNVTCFGDNNGTIDLTVTGGTYPQYTYTWMSGGKVVALHQDLVSLPPGTYSVTVTDENGCTATASVGITQPAKLDATALETDNLCFGDTDGSVDATVTGGVLPYSYSWTGPGTYTASTQDISGLASGLYVLNVTDGNNCSFGPLEAYIDQPALLTASAFMTQEVSCNGASDGAANLTVLGGTMPYSYAWTGSGTFSFSGEDLSNAAAGTYNVTVTDINACQATTSVNITTVLDVTDPVITCIGNQAVNTASTSCVYTVSGTAWDATATDNCFLASVNYVLTGATTGSGTSLNGVSFNLGVTTVTWTATDGLGNTDVCFYIVTVTDVTNPILTNCVADQTVSSSAGVCTYTVSGTAWDATATDNCTSLTITAEVTGVSNATSLTTLNGFVFNLGTSTVTWTVVDGSGNTVICEYDVTITDDQDPILTNCVADQTVSSNAGVCTYTVSGTAWDATATDNCTTVTITANVTGATTASGLTTLNNFVFNLGTSTVTWTVVDGSGNTVICEYDVTVTDDQDPILTNCVADQTVSSNAGVCTYTVSGTAWDATATDNCTTVTITANVTGATTASGLTTLNNFVFNLGTSTVTWTVVDGSGNTVICEYDVTVTDDQDPILTNCVADQTVSSNAGVCTYTVSGTAWDATATDNCTTVTITANVTGATTASGLTTLNNFVFNLGTSTVTWTVVDGSGNTVICEYDVTVTDDQDPILTNCVADQTVSSNAGVCTYTVSGTAWDATATDNCTTVTITANVTGATTASGLTTLNNFVFNLGTSTVTWTVVDGSGNTVICEYDITVTDDQDPILANCVTNQSVTSDAGVCTYTVAGTAWDATATDNCTTVTLTANVTGATTAAGLTTLNNFVFNLGTSTVTWTAIDGTGNISECSFIVTVADNQLPSFTTCVGSTQNVNVDVNECNYTVTGTGWDAIAADNCTVSTVLATLTGATTASGLTTLNNVNFNVGTTVVTWTVTDGSGNTQTCVFNVVVTDNIVPSFTTCGAPGDQTVNANTGLCSYTHPNNSWNASATDNCTVSTVTASLTGVTTASGLSTLNGVTFNLGTTAVTWTATDIHGNVSTCAFNVNVVDNQNPVITSCGAVGNQIVVADPSECNFTQTGTGWNASATDNCSVSSIVYTLSGATTGTGTSLQGVDFNLGITTVLWTVTDGSGNVSTCTFNVTVQDTQLPQITSCGATGNQTVSTDPGVCTYTVSGTAWDASATDNCTVSSLTYTLTGATSGTGTLLNGVVFNPGTTLVTWTVVDQSGNSSNCSFSVTVEDNENPVISGCPTNITTPSDAGVCGAIVTWTVPSYTDNCGAAMTFTHTPGTLFPVGTTTVTYTVTDGAGNVSICSFTVTVNDTELPVITCAQPIETCEPLVIFSAPVVSDNCGVASVVQTAGFISGVEYPVGITTNTYLVTDVNGNTNTCSFTVEVFPVPVIALDPTNVSCFGFDNGSIDATITIGTAPYTYDWSNNATTEDVTGLAPGSYTLDVIDDNGCTASASTVITQPTVLTLAAEDDNVNCFNGTDGAINITVSGGTLPYTYDWSNGASSEDLSNLSAGNYDVTVTDALGCEISYSTEITQPDTLMIQYQVYNATCTAANGSIQVQVTGGTTPYEYNWSDGSTGLNLNNVVEGDYTFYVVDAQGCTNSFTATITSSSNISAVANVKDVRCYNESNGEIQVTILSGNAPFTYEWSNGDSAPTSDSLAAGDYSVLVSDAFGCETTLNVTVDQPDSLYVTLSNSVYTSGDNVSVHGGNDGYLNSQVYGGVSPYDFTWSNGETTQNISGLTAGTYSLIVTDNNGCVAYASTRLTQPDLLAMPNGFSPNGDGTNDNFVIMGIDAYLDNELLIYNRWGNIVYQKESYQNEWNGDNSNGEALPDGTYFAILKVIAGDEEIILKGYVDLRR